MCRLGRIEHARGLSLWNPVALLGSELALVLPPLLLAFGWVAVRGVRALLRRQLDEAELVRTAWDARGTTAVPLEIEEARFRDIGDPLLAHIRGITEDPETVAVTIMPELVSVNTNAASTMIGWKGAGHVLAR